MCYPSAHPLDERTSTEGITRQVGFEIPRTDSYPATGTPSKPGVRDELSANRIDLRWKQPRPVAAPRGTIRTSGRPVMKATTPDGCDDHQGRPRHQRAHTPVFHFLRQASESGRTQTPKPVSRRERTRARALASPQPNQSRERATQSPTRPRHTHAHRRAFLRTVRSETEPTVCESYSYPGTATVLHAPEIVVLLSPSTVRAPDETRRTEPHRTRPAPNTTTTTALQGRPLSDGLSSGVGSVLPDDGKIGSSVKKNQPGAPDGPRIVPRR